MALLACLIAFLAITHVQAQTQARDARLEQCKRNGWIFIPDKQQESWQAIMHCNSFREPWTDCDNNPECIGFTSNGYSGNGWMYRLPRLKACGPLDNPRNLDWEFSWKWVDMICKDTGPCCGTYLANSAGRNAAFSTTCQNSAGLRSQLGAGVVSNVFKECPEKCPTTHTTHLYGNIKIWEVDCNQKRREAGVGARHRALLGSTAGSAREQYSVVVVKRPNGVTSKKAAFIREAESGACTSVSQFCQSFKGSRS